MDEYRELDAKLAEQWLGWTRGRAYCAWVHSESDVWLDRNGKEVARVTRPPFRQLPRLSTTYEGFGILNEEAERRGWDEVEFMRNVWTGYAAVRCIMHNGLQMVEGCGKDKRHAFATACLAASERE